MTAPRKKLIEVSLPLGEINDASAYDKMPGIGPHPKGIHHWWARLPLPTARAIIFASVVDDPQSHPDKWPTEAAQHAERERLFDILRRLLTSKLHQHSQVYTEAREEMLKYCNGKLPTLFDPFAGGGSIPLEANRLGFETHAADLNPVAVLLNKCNLELLPRWIDHPPVNPKDRGHIGGTQAWLGADGLATDVRYYGTLIRDRAQSTIGHLYPKVRLPKDLGDKEVRVIAWTWARTVASPNPAARGRHVPLASTLMLSTKGDKRVWIELTLDPAAPDGWAPRVCSGTLSREKTEAAKLGTKAGKAQDFICVLTGAPIPRSYVQAEGKAGRLGRRLMAVIAEGERGKIYLSANSEHERIGTLPDARADDARSGFLAGPLPTRAEITGGVCTAYGLSTWGHLFTTRQLVTLQTLSDLVREIAVEVHKDALLAGLCDVAAQAYSRTVATFLALSLDRCADFNNSLCRWKPSGEQSLQLFARQALPMVFDFVEANLLGEKAVCWHTAVHICADAIRSIASRAGTGASAQQGDAAQGTTRSSGSLLVSTDPPYYDNISYGTLSDFFYVWLRRTIGSFYPELFSTVLTPKLPELIASPDRFGGSREAAREHFETGFRNAFTAMRSRLDPRFPMTVYYAFKQDDERAADDGDEGSTADLGLTTGWETLLEALIASGFCITATWPVRASQKWRLVSMGTNALASYIVLSCRPISDLAPQSDRRSFTNELRRELPAALHYLQQGHIAPVDLAQASIGPGMAIYSRYKRVVEADGTSMTVRTALKVINQCLDEYLTAQEGDLDSDTRFAVSWFDINGWNAGRYGDAETLASARNVSVAGIAEAGVVHSAGGKVRLLRREELPADWDPSRDNRLTVWESAQHLIKRLEERGEEAASQLLKQLGSTADSARDLAYRLYSTCERKGWVDEARAYNSLVIAWPEIEKLASGTVSAPEQLGLGIESPRTPPRTKRPKSPTP